MEDLVDMEEMTDAEVRELDFQSYFRMGLVTKQARFPVLRAASLSSPFSSMPPRRSGS